MYREQIEQRRLFMASGYYVVLALGVITMLGALIWPLAAHRPQPVRIKADRSPRHL